MSKDFEQLMLRVNARRVLAVYYDLGEPAPQGALAILEGDTTVKRAEDTRRYFQWCERHGLECVAYDEGIYSEFTGTEGEFKRILNPPPRPPHGHLKASETIQ